MCGQGAGTAATVPTPLCLLWHMYFVHIRQIRPAIELCEIEVIVITIMSKIFEEIDEHGLSMRYEFFLRVPLIPG